MSDAGGLLTYPRNPRPVKSIGDFPSARKLVPASCAVRHHALMESIKPMKSTLEAAPSPARAAAAILILVVLPRAQESTVTSGLTLTVPPGFVVERVAGPPLVDRPIVADFDDEGRLYVADSSGSNDRVEKQLADRPHRIVRLEDTNADGRFDKSVVFADKMMLPEGTMWLDGSLYVAAPPSIWKLTDTNGDGVADQREEWFQGQTLTGCANDLHGPYLGPDGWIYWTKGAFAQQTYERTPGPALVTRAAHILRRRPGDPAIEVVMTGGMDNPVDVAFTPTGERILSATFLEHPQAGRRDAPGSRHLRRRLREAARRPRRAQADRRSDARAVRAWPRRSGRADSIRLARLRRRVSRQLFRGDVQPAQGDAPCARSRTARRSGVATRTFSSRRIAIFIQPTSSKTRMAASSSSTPGPGTSSAARRRSSPSRKSSARSIAFGGRGATRPDDPRGRRLAWNTMTALPT